MKSTKVVNPAQSHCSKLAKWTPKCCNVLVTLIVLLFTIHCYSQVGINSTGAAPNNSAILDASSSNQGVLINRMTTAQRNAISSPAASLMIFNTTTNCFESFVNGAWNSVACPAPCTPPSAPVAASPTCFGPAQFIANWSASAGATSYFLDISTDNFTTFLSGFHNLNVGNLITFTVTGLTTGTTYYYQVRAAGACISGNSNTITYTLPSSASQVGTPTAGTNSACMTQIIWNWNAVSGATGYKWGTINDFLYATDNGSGTTLTQTGLTCGTVYNLYVWAYKSCGNYSLTPLILTQSTASCGSGCKATNTITSASGKTIYTFNQSGTFTPVTDHVSVLVVAGGGGGGIAGGGAGGVVYNASFAVTIGQHYTVTVGAGGVGFNGGQYAGFVASTEGQNSVFSTITAIGGGGGGADGSGSQTSWYGHVGGSGGGGFGFNGGPGGPIPFPGGDGTAGQGNKGGWSSGINGVPYYSGGGGGAVGLGGDGTGSAGGAGGIGVTNSITGTSVYYGGGGGGSGLSSGGAKASGGLGGGGESAINSCGNKGQNGTPNTGGGGGGGNVFGGGGDGGCGVVIISY
jgi:hypothetical protein